MPEYVTFEVVQQYDHYVVLRNGKFFCSADTRAEAEHDKYEAESERNFEL